MTTASKITMVRIVLIPFFMVFLILSGNGGANADTYRWIALAIFIIASVSDFLDGYVARHYNQVTDFGKFFDTLADKLLVTACLLIFVGQGRMADWIPPEMQRFCLQSAAGPRMITKRARGNLQN